MQWVSAQCQWCIYNVGRKRAKDIIGYFITGYSLFGIVILIVKDISHRKSTIYATWMQRGQTNWMLWKFRIVWNIVISYTLLLLNEGQGNPAKKCECKGLKWKVSAMTGLPRCWKVTTFILTLLALSTWFYEIIHALLIAADADSWNSCYLRQQSSLLIHSCRLLWHSAPSSFCSL